MPTNLKRRRVLGGMGAAALLAGVNGCTSPAGVGRRSGAHAPRLELAPILAQSDRITRITVCTRPFRPQGPRLDVEVIGSKTVVHNYGHGGSGWSLSWGSSAIAVSRALAGGERNIGVIGCGALGLTSALLLQRAGASVTVYAKELPPNVRSSMATGVWTPDSRICLEENASAAFKQQWQSMARQSFQTYQNYLGLAGNPVEFIDRYIVSDDASPRRKPAPDGRPAFAELQRELIGELIPKSVAFEPGSHNLGPRYLRRDTMMMFNLPAYSRMLVADYLQNGGKIVITEFHSPSELSSLHEKTLINATGYGARALFGDESVVPVRGQLARVIPQPEVNYGLYYKDVSFVPRRDGLVFQVVGDSDYYGFNDEGVQPDQAEAEHSVNTIAALFARPPAI
jgi:glycine/D-amino acid oxidase-like deaminating enzyme